MDAIEPASLFELYPDTGVAAAASAHHIADVKVAGTVVSDPHYFRGDHTGALHESFDIVTQHGLRIEIIDNVDLAPRVPVHTGDVVVVAGQYIPRHGRGLIHDTHHQPGPGWHQGGWIEWDGERYESLQAGREERAVLGRARRER